MFKNRVLWSIVGVLVWSVGALVYMQACKGSEPVLDPVVPARLDQPVVMVSDSEAPHEALRLILVGDTGYPGGPVREMRAAIKAEERKDAVLALGDLVYPVGPVCLSGRAEGQNLEILQERVGAALEGLGAPVWMVIGNHEVDGKPRDPVREACILDFASQREDLYFPALTYKMDIKGVRVIVINTNDLTPEDGQRVAAWTKEAPGEVIIAGHHVLRTYWDKRREDKVLPWLQTHGIAPDLYVNGHAHFLQFGVYEGIPAVTSGSGSKLRDRPACPDECGDGQLWGRSVHGYVVLDLEKEALVLTFKDQSGATLWTWTRPETK